MNLACTLAAVLLIFVAVDCYHAEKTYSIALIGDSLFNRPTNLHGLIEKIQANLPEYSLNITNHAGDGARIKVIRDLLPIALNDKPGLQFLIYLFVFIPKNNPPIVFNRVK